MLITFVCVGAVGAFHAPTTRPGVASRGVVNIGMQQSEPNPLTKSFTQHVAALGGSGDGRMMPLEDMAAAKMDAAQVVSYCLDAFKPEEEEDDPWQFSNTQAEVAGAAYKGCHVLMSFSAKLDAKVDDLGWLQPGAYGFASKLEAELLRQENYRSLALLSEWKTLAPSKSDGGASASRDTVSEVGDSETLTVLVRQEGFNWEELRVTLELCAMPDGAQRWLIMGLLKDRCDPKAARSGRVSGDDDLENPEESRNC